nr:Helicase associated domain protein [Streptomyces sp. 846.5]
MVWHGLTNGQRQRLEALGVEPEAAPTTPQQPVPGGPSTAFTRGLAALRQYRERTGTVVVPRTHTEEVEGTVVKLGVWTSNTKSRRDKLTTEQLAALAELGLQWRRRAISSPTVARIGGGRNPRASAAGAAQRQRRPGPSRASRVVNANRDSQRFAKGPAAGVGGRWWSPGSAPGKTAGACASRWSAVASARSTAVGRRRRWHTKVRRTPVRERRVSRSWVRGPVRKWARRTVRWVMPVARIQAAAIAHGGSASRRGWPTGGTGLPRAARTS